MPDLPEQSRAPREGPDPRLEGSEVISERRAVETALGAPAIPASPSGNGSSGHLGEAGGAVTDPDPLDDGTGGSATGPLDEVDRDRAQTDGTGGPGEGDETKAAEEGGEGDESPPGGRRKPRSGWRSAIEWALVIGGALLVALVVRTFLVQAFWIPSASMEPTLHEGDRVLVNKLSYDLHDVRHGDVIVFERPDEPSDVPHPEDEIQDLIKRVIALPGDVIESRDGIVYLNDEPLDEPYLAPDTPTTDLPRQKIPEGKVFVMGDNRTNSHDSRRFGPIDESSIVGRAFLRIYPLDDIGGL